MRSPVRSRPALNLARAATELAERAQAGEEGGGFERGVLEVLERHVGCETSLIVSPALEGGAVTHHMEGAARAVLRLLLDAPERYAQTMRRAEAAFLQAGIWVDHETFDAYERRNLPLYRELFRPLRLSSSLMLAPRWRGQLIGAFGLHRYDGRSFSPRQRERAQNLVPALQLAWAARERALQAKQLEVLTPREREVARHVARGLSTPQIAILLGSSPHTVRNQLVRIFDKLGVASRAELAAFVAARSGGAHLTGS